MAASPSALAMSVLTDTPAHPPHPITMPLATPLPSSFDQATPWGAQLASHPVAFWLAGTAMAMLLALVAHRLLGATRLHGMPSQIPMTRTAQRPAAGWVVALSIVCATALVLAVAGAAGISSLASSGQAGGFWGALDDALAAGLHAQAPVAVLQFFAGLTHLGDSGALAVAAVVVACVLWAAGHRLLATGWLVAMGGNGVSTRVLKHLFERVRPEHTHGIAHADGFSFPSGHSSASIVAYSLLAYIAVRLLPRPWHLPLALLAGAVIFTTGWSRVVLQVHYASDVLAGWLLGGMWALCAVLVIEGMSRWRSPRAAVDKS